MSKKLYDKLIEHARGSIRETGEIHHVIPRCLGGTDDDSNLVRLSIHEHIWAHIWLAEMYPNEWGLQSAVSMMVYGINESLGRKPTSEQICAAVGARGRKSLSEGHKQKIADALRGNPGPFRNKSHSEETKQKMSKSAKENGNLQGVPPWSHPRTLRSPKSLQVWFHADSYFDLWKEHQCADAKLAKLFGVAASQSHRNLVLKFRAGWVPNEDPEWKTFKEQHE